MKITVPKKIGEAVCEKHNTTYNIYDGDGGIGCVQCYAQKIKKRNATLFAQMDKAHKDAANSTLTFGKLLEQTVEPTRVFLGKFHTTPDKTHPGRIYPHPTKENE